jgi:hypothetical protein
VDTDGCECATPSCCGTSCETTHNDGFNQNFYDCSPLNTYTSTSAMEACIAYAPTVGGTSANCHDGWGCMAEPSLNEVCYTNTSDTTCKTYCWVYSYSPGFVTTCSDCTTSQETWN